MTVDKPTLERALFDYLLSVCDGRPQPSRAMLTDSNTLGALYAQPHPNLGQALHHCVDALLIELVSEPLAWGQISVPTSALGVALAASNCLSKSAPLDKGRVVDDPVTDFTTALVDTLPPARERDVALAYHSVLRGVDKSLPYVQAKRAEALHSLIERCPLTALWALDAHTPAALERLAATLLPGWRGRKIQGVWAWRDADDWLDAVSALLSDEHIARYVRRRWLALAETRVAARNVGLALEALRRRGSHRTFILEFYETYDYFRTEKRVGERRGHTRAWPVLATIEKLLLTPGDSEAAIAVNRRGNEYFLKFRPLLEIVIAENGIPTDYDKLSREFVLELRRLIDYVTERSTDRIAFTPVTFNE